MKDKLHKRHLIDYWSAIEFFGLKDEYFLYLEEQLRLNRRRKKCIFSTRRLQRTFCAKKGLKLKHTPFDLSCGEGL